MQTDYNKYSIQNLRNLNPNFVVKREMLFDGKTFKIGSKFNINKIDDKRLATLINIGFIGVEAIAATKPSKKAVDFLD